MSRLWLLLGTALDLLLALPAFYMAIAAVDIAARGGGFGVAVAALFFMLPVFCIAAPVAAWRTQARGRGPAHGAVLFALPWVYAAFLVTFLLFG